MGTTKLTTNGSQGVTSTQEMDAFGREVSTTGSTASPFGFHGAEGYRNDGDNPSGLDPYQRVGARYYDRLTGRFITRDTDLSQSPYAYCDGDPVNCTDPSGHAVGDPPPPGQSPDQGYGEPGGPDGDGGTTGPGGGGPSGGPGGGGSASPARPIVIPTGGGTQLSLVPASGGGFKITASNSGPLSMSGTFNNKFYLTSVGGGTKFAVGGVPGLFFVGSGSVNLGTGASSYMYGFQFMDNF